MFFSLDIVSDIASGIGEFFGSAADYVIGVGQAVSNGIGGFLSDIGSNLLDFIIFLLSSAINILFMPINLLFTTFFTDLSNTITTAVDNINVFITNVHNFPISLFVNILPNSTKNALLIYLSFLIGYYLFAFSYRSIRVVINIFHKIKFW